LNLLSAFREDIILQWTAIETLWAGK
jgi:hypothetical protein